MSFDSVSFWLVFPCALAAWWLLPWRAAKAVALGFSLLFYGWWNPWYLPLILASSLVDWFAGARIAASAEQVTRRRWLALSLATNLGLLATFKYAAFALTNIDRAARALGGGGFEVILPWVVPVGISFYTFQTLSYTLDIYWRRLAPARTFVDFFLYVAFYPQLVAGPIVRASTLLPQLERPPRASAWRLQHGAYMCVQGLFLKVVVADNLAPEVDRLMSLAAAHSPALTPAAAWLGMLYFGVELFADFAGYSAIAIGLACLLGLRFPTNFLYPLLARGPAEFWQRWHITLSTWFRDYVYIPLGGSRGGPWRTYANLVITMLLSGLWHGAAWGMLVWGGLHALALCLERALRGRRAPSVGVAPLRSFGGFAGAALGIVVTQLFVLVAWVFFRAPNLADAGRIAHAMLIAPFGDPLGWAALGHARHLVLVLPVVLMHARRGLREWCGWRETASERALVFAAMAFLLLVVRRDGAQEFLYFQF
ncbi:MAG: MBOAT family O-acyltransferase [Planctomycetota bacterium]